MLEEIALAIKQKYFSPDEFFSKFEYNKYAKVIPQGRFEDALRDLKLYYNSRDLDIIKTQLDPNASGRLDVAPIMNWKPETAGDRPGLSRAMTVTRETLTKSVEDLSKSSLRGIT